MFPKVPVIVITRFGENNVLCPKYIGICEFWGVQGGEVHIPPYIFCLLFKKTEKYKSMTYTKIQFYIILIFFFQRINNKKITKRGPRGPRTYFFTKWV